MLESQPYVTDCLSDVPRVPQNSVSEDSTTPMTAPQQEVPGLVNVNLILFAFPHVALTK